MSILSKVAALVRQNLLTRACKKRGNNKIKCERRQTENDERETFAQMIFEWLSILEVCMY